MTKRMLIDATDPAETRVVILDGSRVEEFDHEVRSKAQLKGNIYLAKVTRVEPSLQAAFVDYGGNRHGFLPFSEIHPDYYRIPIADREALLAEEASLRDGDEDEAAESKPRKGRAGRRERGRDRDRGRDRRRAASEPPIAQAMAEEPAAEAVPPEAPVSDEAGAPEAFEAPAPVEAALPAPVEAAAVESAPAEAPVESERSAEPAPAEAAPAETLAAEPVAEAAVEAPPAKPRRTRKPKAAAAPAAEAAAGEPAPKPRRTRKPKAAVAPAEAAPAEPAAEGEPDTPAGGRSQPHVASTGDQVSELPVEPAEAAEAAAPATGRGVTVEEVETEQQIDTLDGDEVEDVARRRAKLLRRYKIQEVIKRGQIMLVQVAKEERGTKGAALTTYLSLPGRFCVLMPNTARGGGISRKIGSATDRKRLKAVLGDLEIPDGMAVIVRTAGSERSKAEIKRDYEYLLRLWSEIRETTLASQAPALIYEEGDLIKRAIRDLYTSDIEDILVEGEEAYKAAKAFMKNLMPSHARRIQLYKESSAGLFQRYQVETQLAAMFEPTVQLKSGGYIVINVTEALVAIDVNSGRATRERHIEETALKTNLEAADEVARQLRLRDLAGLIVIDFIDMEETKHNRDVERRLKDAMRNDRARIQLGRISPFGLLELSRQRLRPSLVETATVLCPHCHGTGRVYSPEAAALHLLRALAEEGTKHPGAELVVHLPAAVALHLLNHKRAQLAAEEERYGLELQIDIDESLTGLQFRIEAPGQPQPAAREGDRDRRGRREGERGGERGREGREGERQRDRERGDREKGDRERGERRSEPHRRHAEPEAPRPQPEAAAPPPVEDEEEDEVLVQEAAAERPAAPAPAPAAEGDDDRPRRRRRRGKRGGRRRGRREDGTEIELQGGRNGELSDEAEDDEDEGAEPETDALTAEAEEAPLPLAEEEPEAEPSLPAVVAEPPAAVAAEPPAPVAAPEPAPAPAAPPPQPEPAQTSFQPITELDPNRPKRRGWWNRLTG